MARGEAEEKARDLLSGVIRDRGAKGLIGAVWRLERTRNVVALRALLYAKGEGRHWIYPGQRGDFGRIIISREEQLDNAPGLEQVIRP